MTLNGVMVLILSYFTKFGSFRGALRKMIEDVVIKKFTFAVSYPDEFLVCPVVLRPYLRLLYTTVITALLPDLPCTLLYYCFVYCFLTNKHDADDDNDDAAVFDFN